MKKKRGQLVEKRRVFCLMSDASGCDAKAMDMDEWALKHLL